jgi:sRNA-binding protein
MLEMEAKQTGGSRPLQEYRARYTGNGGRILCKGSRQGAAGMASQYRIERDRGTKESPQQFALVREKWPLAFPVNRQDIRPLAIGATREIAAAMGWSLPYTLGVLGHWKLSPVYCEAVLRHDQRIALDGATAEAVDAKAKDLAAKRLAQLAARNIGKAREVKPKPVPTPPTETPEQLRARVRASLLRRST